MTVSLICVYSTPGQVYHWCNFKCCSCRCHQKLQSEKGDAHAKD